MVPSPGARCNARQSEVSSQFGLPKDNADEDTYADYHLREYVEVQVWSDAPVAAWLS
ncbi:MAG: hypothetical protein IKE42_02085 [Aquamicrobium sp.]|uniref:hypothetical protein n=1 Tax=Mesorhizobium sp. Pch-S TaxID=2082387 RepID=UPI0013EE2031|nr:hypothetical protein [Mesorhizobium sp. Pch-S]MBR2686616.1 hypothetical protein [Aquamicrobium sp.]